MVARPLPLRYICVMKLALFGATGRTGRLLLRQALDAGHSVTALVRDRDKITTLHKKLRVLEGDVRDFGAVERAINGADAVLSTLGHRGLLPSTLVSEAVSHMVTIMERSHVKRIVTVASSGIMGESGLGMFLNVALASSQADHRRQFQLLRDSDLDWTVVRPVVLTNGPQRGKYRVVKKGVPRRGFFISRADLAHFMLKCAVGGKHLKSSPAVAY